MANSDMFSIESEDMVKLGLDLKFYHVWGKTKAHSLLNHWADVAQVEIRRNASQRPGPRIRTGEYVRSIMVRRGGSGDDYRVHAYSTHPAAHRLEYGFAGKDSLGRNYSQPPFPHFGPAMTHIAPLMHEDMANQLVKWWKQ